MSNHEFTNWTALPNGIIGDTVGLSVFVTPKLLGEAGTVARLGDYQAILKWPETIQGLSLTVEAQLDAGISGAPLTLAPANRGELGPNGAIWRALFSEHTRVEPFAPDAAPAVAATARRTVPVYYRSLPLQSLVEETYAVQARLALADLESEPARPQFDIALEAYDSPDALLSLAGGSQPALTAQQFAVRDGDTLSFRSTRAVTAFFTEERLTNAAGPLAMAATEPMTRAQIRELFDAFSLYHKRGIRNQLRQIRAPRRWRSRDANFNFHASDRVQITRGDHGKEFEFAESKIMVLLPELASGDRGFEVLVAYSPNEALPAAADDAAEPERTYRREDESLEQERYERYLTVNASGANLFVDGAAFTRIAAQRARHLTWNGTRWLAPDEDDLDFHAILSGLTSYPALIRRLGWVFDLEIPLNRLFPDFTPGAAFTGRIKVVPVWADPANAPTMSSPWTLFAVGERSGTTAGGTRLTSFSARLDPGRPDEPLAAGFRDLSPASAHQYDLDASAVKTVQKAIREADLEDRYLPAYRIEIPGSPRAAALNSTPHAALLLGRTIDIDPDHRAAALRSTGISLYADREYARFAKTLEVDSRRIATFATRLKETLAAAAAAPGPRLVAGDDVYLNDVVAGYIIDVHDSATRQWYSLCERQVVFKFDHVLPPYLAPADEGWVSAEAMVETDEDGHKQLRNTENFFRWDGWSLVAPNPSEPIKPCEPVATDPPPKNLGLKPEVETKPLSLARLRFGQSYKFRARLADLAGNAWPRSYANALAIDDLASPEVMYRRYDPINPPFLVPLQPPGPGIPVRREGEDAGASKGPEKGEMLVIRSGLGAAAATGEWLVLPPEIKFQEAEWIGMFDALGPPDKAYSILSRYCGVLPDKYEAGFIARITWPNGKLATPYLPDGHAAGAAFTYLPGGSERKSAAALTGVKEIANAAIAATTTFDFALDLQGPKNARPFAQPFRFRLTSGAKRMKPQKLGPRLTVTLPPGEQQLIRVSSTPFKVSDIFAQVHNAFAARQETFIIQPRDAARLGRANWNALSGFTEKFKEAIERGQFWPLTPQKNLYLVHAVPKPLVPTIKDSEQKAFRFSESLMVAPRATGGVATVLHDPDLRVHRASTGRIDVYAEWDEHSDAPGMAACPHKVRRRHLCFSYDVDLPDLTIDPDDSHMTVDFARRHEFPDTRHYAVKYQMVATTRYREYYDPKFVAKAENITITSEQSKVFHILNTVPPPVFEFVYVLPILIREPHAAIPASPYGGPAAAPPSHKVRRGLRVYMRRIGWQSGEDERLAVVFAPTSAAAAKALDADSENQLPVTQWGTNPIWYTEPIKRQPTVNDALVESAGMRFLGIKIAKKSTTAALAAQRDAAAVAAAESGVAPAKPLENFRQADRQVTLDAADVEIVDVAAFALHCDHDKDLLYADVEFKDTKSYSLMVKMSLARFQPHSAPYAHLSPLTSAAFQALSPERMITYIVVSEVNEDPPRPTRQLKFTISGTAPGDSRLGHRENSLEVLLYDGDNPVSESQLPLSVDNLAHGFRIPVKLLEGLKRPNLHIKEFEYIANRHPRLVLAAQIPLDYPRAQG